MLPPDVITLISQANGSEPVPPDLPVRIVVLSEELHIESTKVLDSWRY